MRIGIITDSMDTITTGIGNYTKNLVNEILNLNTNDDIYLIHNKKTDNTLYKISNEIIIPNLISSSLFHSISIISIHRPFLLKKYNLDLLHYTDFRVPPTYWALKPTKNISTVHSTDPLLLPCGSSITTRSIFQYLGIINKKMDAVITVSESEKKLINKIFRIPEEKIKVTYLGVDTNIFKKLDFHKCCTDIFKKYSIKPPFMLHVGHYRPIKNTYRVLQAFHQLKKRGIDSKLVVIGKHMMYFNQIRDVIKKYNLENDVIFTGYVPLEDLPKFYNIADVFIHPSLHESFGLVLLEAMACGCPVVTSNIYSMPEIAGDSAFLVDPYDTNEIATGIYEVLASDRLRNNLIKKGLKRIKSFTWDKCAKKTFQVYKEVLEH